MLPVIFTDFRRELLARTLFDLLKISVVAVFASKFFLELPRMVQLLIGVGMVGVAVFGFFLCPPKKPKE